MVLSVRGSFTSSWSTYSRSLVVGPGKKKFRVFRRCWRFTDPRRHGTSEPGMILFDVVYSENNKISPTPQLSLSLFLIPSFKKFFGGDGCRQGIELRLVKSPRSVSHPIFESPRENRLEVKDRRAWVLYFFPSVPPRPPL